MFRLLVVEVRKEMFRNVLFIDGLSASSPLFGAFLCVPNSFNIIHGSFFRSNWESKKTILLLVLLLNFNISQDSPWNYRSEAYINYTYVPELLTRQTLSWVRQTCERDLREEGLSIMKMKS